MQRIGTHELKTQFNTNATLARVQAFVRSITYRNVAYGEGITLGFGGELEGAQRPLVSDVANHPLRLEERTQLFDDGAGGMIERTIRFPAWIDAAASGRTGSSAGT